MISVDTNLAVRILTGDDAGQTAAAAELFENNTIWIGKTILLECAWVLESKFGLSEADVLSAIARLIGLPNVKVEDEPAVLLALKLSGEGLEFSDALHLASRPKGAMFASFDRALVRRAICTEETGIFDPSRPN